MIGNLVKTLMKFAIVSAVAMSAGCSSPDPLGHYKGPAIDAIYAKMREVAEERFGVNELVGLGDRESDAENLVMNNHNKGYSIEGFVFDDTSLADRKTITYRISTGDDHQVVNLVIRFNDQEPEILIGDKDWDQMKRLVN